MYRRGVVMSGNNQGNAITKDCLKFSIILPVYNREKIVPFTIQSVLAQDYPNWELIIVDDTSTDGSHSVCEQFSIQDSRIKLYRHSINKGLSGARNTGLKYADGDYILFIDDDDQIKENTLSALYVVCSDIKTDMIVFGIQGRWIPSETICNRVLDSDFIHNYILPQHINICEHTELFLQPYVWNKCYRREMFSEHGLKFEERRRVWEDNVFLIQCFDKCKDMYVLHDELHIPGGFSDIDHLSSHVDGTVILQYIDGYKNNLRQFGDRYDFNNDYTPRRYFDVINEHLTQLILNTSEVEFKVLLNQFVNEPVMQGWAKTITPNNKLEKDVKKLYRSKDIDKLYLVYQKTANRNNDLNILSKTNPKRIINRIRRQIKSIYENKFK